ncbi:MAG TPA: HNH endonuclease [Polyangium sp.]|uniref:HNH endonuclease n=2 Tax=Polyangium TaxID=55 RepID=A0A4U1J0X0_9BACT|nr:MULTISPECIES: HNH endonuclease [Polyangium]MDI1430598.1 HNH endonuclease [Polyangium sorediatum]TKD00678.1 HNH endonuclease [Polyangium fumosum]HVK67707.1 HNH endonuclease [Polyangium sp.]
MTAQTLLLTPWMVPHQVISWQTAVTLSFLGKVEVLETYDDEIRSPTMTIRAPAVVRLKRHGNSHKRGIKFSRTNVFVRDDFRCQYCGVQKDAGELTYDHVLPRVQGGRTVWENIVASCQSCNAKKRGRTPEQAGMKLLKKPEKPRWLPAAPVVRLGARRIPEIWVHYCAAS